MFWWSRAQAVFKSTGYAIPTALEWCDGLVCLDPKGEIYRASRSARKALGHRVISLDPENPQTAGFNPLDFIDISSGLSVHDIRSVATWIMGERANEPDPYSPATRSIPSRIGESPFCSGKGAARRISIVEVIPGIAVEGGTTRHSIRTREGGGPGAKPKGDGGG
jgi:hypothetical protein